MLTVEGRTWLLGDAVLLGRHTGDWSALEERAALALGLEAAGHEPDSDAVTEAVVAFRRRKRLLAAEDLRDWAASHDLTVERIEASFARGLLRARVPPGPVQPAGAQAVERVIWDDALCDGTLEHLAEALAERAVAYEAIGGADVHDRMGLVLAADSALSAWRDSCADEEQLQARLRERRLVLTRVGLDALTLGGEQAAREAVLCVKEDGQGLHQVAARAGGRVERIESELGNLEGPLLAAAAATRPGDVVGPVVVEEGDWRVAVVRERKPPALTDPEVRDRLIREIFTGQMARRAAGRVVWHVSF